MKVINIETCVLMISMKGFLIPFSSRIMFRRGTGIVN